MSVAMMANMPICIHLSIQMVSIQFFCGKAVPGSVRRIMEMISQVSAGAKKRNDFMSTRINKTKETPKWESLLNQL